MRVEANVKTKRVQVDQNKLLTSAGLYLGKPGLAGAHMGKEQPEGITIAEHPVSAGRHLGREPLGKISRRARWPWRLALS